MAEGIGVACDHNPRTHGHGLVLQEPSSPSRGACRPGWVRNEVRIYSSERFGAAFFPELQSHQLQEMIKGRVSTVPFVKSLVDLFKAASEDRVQVCSLGDISGDGFFDGPLDVTLPARYPVPYFEV